MTDQRKKKVRTLKTSEFGYIIGCVQVMSTSLLAIDVGNTNICFGLYSDNKLLGCWRIGTHEQRTNDCYIKFVIDICASVDLNMGTLTGVVIASVVPKLLKKMKWLFQQTFPNTLVVVVEPPYVGINTTLDELSQVGADRIVNVMAANKLYPGPVVVIDFGTATKFDCIDKHQNFIGGAICPGLLISAEALFDKAARLNSVKIVPPSEVIGKNTVQAVRSGIYYGYVGLVEGILERLLSELDCYAFVVATGGLSSLICSSIKGISGINPNLTLEGLKYYFETKNRLVNC